MPLEAGIGKSLETDRIIGEYIAGGGQRRFLLVKQFLEDVNASVERINSHRTGELERLLIPWVIGISHKNWHEYRDNLSSIANYRVVVITHQRYLQLCEDESIRGYFADRRDTLVIDEALNMRVATFSDAEYRRMNALLPIPFLPQLHEVCSGLLHEIAVRPKLTPGASLVSCRPHIDNLAIIREFSDVVDANMGSIPFQHWQDVEQFVRSLPILYQNQCLYSRKQLSAVDPNLKPWTLANNIVMDAAGEIDHRYRLNPMVTIDHQIPIIDHSHWTLRQIPYNSSASSINSTTNYTEELVKHIVSRHSPADRTLVVTRIQFEDKLKSMLSEAYANNVTVEHFGNIVGKNHWRDYTQIWIAVTPLLPMEMYVLYWSMATGEPFDEHHLKTVTTKGRKVNLQFQDTDVESIRFGYVVSEMYQAIKRINRDNRYPAEVFVVTQDDAIIAALQNQLPGIKIGEPIVMDVHKETKTAAKETTAQRLAEYLKTLPPGQYTKQQIYSAIGIDKSNFGRALKDAEIAGLVQARLIRISRWRIEVLAH